MTERITHQRVASVLASYAGLLVNMGVCTPEQVQGLCMASPYGQLRYVCRDTDAGHIHDVPGFVGSGTDKGFTSIRELYYAVHQSRDAISDALNPYAVERRNREAQVQA
jgi:hypothetical protein